MYTSFRLTSRMSVGAHTAGTVTQAAKGRSNCTSHDSQGFRTLMFTKVEVLDVCLRSYIRYIYQRTKGNIYTYHNSGPGKRRLAIIDT